MRAAPGESPALKRVPMLGSETERYNLPVITVLYFLPPSWCAPCGVELRRVSRPLMSSISSSSRSSGERLLVRMSAEMCELRSRTL